MDVEPYRIVVQADRGMTAFHSLRQNHAFRDSKFKRFSTRAEGQAKRDFAKDVKEFLMIICGGSEQDLVDLIDCMFTTKEKMQLQPCNNVINI